jgi:hypothetical protein
VCTLKVCTLIDTLTYRGAEFPNIYARDVDAELAKSIPSTPKWLAKFLIRDEMVKG